MLVPVAAVLLASLMASVCASETLPWGIYRIRGCCNWDNNGDKVVDVKYGSFPGWGIAVAVIDHGIFYTEDANGTKHYNVDLSDNVLGGKGFRYYGGEVEITDYFEDTPSNHGTHVSGTIAAVDNDIGVIGGAPKAKLWALKLYGLDPEKEAARAIRWAVNEANPPALVISMSIGFDTNDSDLMQACDYAYNCGTLLIAASGNSNAGYVEYPAAYDSVIAVGAVNETSQRWISDQGNGSNYGPKLELVAPGTNINSTIGYDDYALKTGTSMAVPHVTAVAAMIFSSKIDPAYDTNHDGYWQNFEVRQKLGDTVLDLGPQGRDNETGWGMVNAWALSMRPLGDVNVDLKVDITDLAIVTGCYGKWWDTPNPPVYLWALADITIDNRVDIMDVSRVVGNYGKIDP
jgi:subtilisin family serine protease